MAHGTNPAYGPHIPLQFRMILTFLKGYKSKQYALNNIHLSSPKPVWVSKT